MIVEAFAVGDRATLRPLVSDAVFAGFDHAIAQRDQAQADHEPWSRHRLIHIDAATIAAAELRGSTAEITVRFASTQAVSDFQGQASRDSQARLTDLWTFQRTLGAADPTWILIATRSLEPEAL
jgi:predicted lipid-binding transport protein (Tim44 family)